MTRLAFVLFAVSACSGNGTPPSATSSPPPVEPHTTEPVTTNAPAGGHVAGGHFLPDGYVEDVSTCSVDSDCTCNTVPDAEQPCCQVPTSLECYRASYWSAIGTWRGTHCGEVTCPPPPPPMLPRECALTARCVEGRCADSCS